MPTGCGTRAGDARGTARPARPCIPLPKDAACPPVSRTAMKSFSTLQTRVISFLCVATFALAARADLKLAAPFRDHAVLQQGMPAPVWGWDRPGQGIIVKFAGQEKPTTAGADGKWMVHLDSLKAGSEGREMTVSGTDTLKIADVLVGEVWVLSGQSNMLFAMGAAVEAQRHQEGDRPCHPLSLR